MPAGTQIASECGSIDIEHVKTGDRVLTRNGYRTVIASAMTSPSAQLVRITTTEGTELRCTSDHLIWTTTDGWKQAGSLTEKDRLLMVRQRGTTSAVDGSTDCPQGTTLPATTERPDDCTSLYGSGAQVVRFLMVLSCIIKTVIRRITTPLISRHSVTETTTACTGAESSEQVNNSKTSGKGYAAVTKNAGTKNSYAKAAGLYSRLKHGVKRLDSVLRAVHRVLEHKNPVEILSGFRTRPSVKNAEVNSHLRTDGQFTAPSSVVKPLTVEIGVKSVSTDTVEAVYDISVEDEHSFFANGVLVHNCDELGMWQRWEQAWDESIKYAVRRSDSKIIATTTPKSSRSAAKLIRRLLLDPTVKVSKLKTKDNAANLSEAFMDSVVGRAKGTKLEKQELEGELIEDMTGALWTHDVIDRYAVDDIPDGMTFRRVVVGVDPSSGKESSDEQAYTVAGYGHDGHLYILESWGARVAVQDFIRTAIDAALRWNGVLVVEKNHGEGFLDFTIKQIQKDMGTEIPVTLVHASRGKRTRAEPVAALYERGFVHHVQKVLPEKNDHSLGEIEDQMTMFTGAEGEKSPDRLDSLVWALTPFLNYSFGNASQRGVVRTIDVGARAEEKFPTKTSRRRGGRRPPPWEAVDLTDTDRDLSEWAPPDVVSVRSSRVKHWHGQPPDMRLA